MSAARKTHNSCFGINLRRRLPPRPQRQRRGLVLLEVVVSLGILLVCMAVIGLVFRNGQYYVEMAEQKSRAMILTDRLIAEIDTNSIFELEEARDQVLTGGFGIEAPLGMNWRVIVNESTRIEGLLEIDVDIVLGDPDGDEDEHKIVMRTRIMRAEPRGIDFEQDFGLDEEQLDQLTELIPGGVQMFDPNNFDPRTLAQMDLDSLVEILPTLLEAFGIQLAQGQMDQIMQAVQSGDQQALQNIGQQVGGGLPGASPTGGQR